MKKKLNIIEVVEASAVISNIVYPANTIITFYNDNSKVKIGDGKTKFNDLSSIGGDSDNIPPEVQTQLDLKAPIASPTFTGTVSGITSTMVGLGNVNNTTDAAKPVSTATQTALNAKLTATTAAFNAKLTATIAATQANSTATDIAGLVTDFNALLAKLKAAGIMTP